MVDNFTPLVAVVSADDDDDRIWPTLSGPEDKFPIELTEADGDTVAYFTASGLSIMRLPASGKDYDEVILDEHKIVCAITDSRVVFACEKYDKGGGWAGVGLAGMTVAAGANLVSKARAARRRKGSVLVGQVRYSWIAYSGARTGSWWSKDQLAIAAAVSKDEGGGGQVIVLQAPASGIGDCHELAAEVTRRAAAWRLEYDKFAGARTRAAMEELKTAERLKGRKGAKQYARHELIGGYGVEDFTAFAMNRNLNEAWEAKHATT
ncbi:hypothetical protein FB382_000065 [Nocardioides ginsengisegetis]|uniref:Uncharacterized protein n=1 Tax=Nocardioides ginsengisegetis TaxID=661491 RepID=A0A7W3IWH5_9ACTN|nr:hypothetical protein [Nocardioides ginsengisegetis]MBA8801774.1 hypothetical protein [Nocardioides ginsengisegetis]